MSGQLISADALHAQDCTARSIVERGGDYLIQIKGNRKTVRETLEKKTHRSTPFLI